MDTGLLYGLLTFGVPLLAAPAAMYWGLGKTLRGVLVIAVLMFIVPFLFYLAASLWFGASLSEVKSLISLWFTGILPAMLVIGGYMLGWSLVYGMAGAGIRWLWQRRKAAI